MQQTIDVTGLSPEVIQAVESLIDGLREQRTAGGEVVQAQWPGPGPGVSTGDCVKNWRAWVYGRVASARLAAAVDAPTRPTMPRGADGAISGLQGGRL